MIKTVINQIFQLILYLNLVLVFLLLLFLECPVMYVWYNDNNNNSNNNNSNNNNNNKYAHFSKNMFCKIYTDPGDSDENASSQTSNEEEALSEFFKTKLNLDEQEDSRNFQAAAIPCATAQVNFRMVKLSHTLGSSGHALWLFSCSTECFNSLSCNLFLHRWVKLNTIHYISILIYFYLFIFCCFCFCFVEQKERGREETMPLFKREWVMIYT